MQEFFILYFTKKTCGGGAFYLHCAFGAELLTAETADTHGAVYLRLSVADDYRFRGADISADAATDALVLCEVGFST